MYKETSKRQLKHFEKLVNDAAVELCLADVSLLDRRGELLQKARRKVADDGYVFKKGRSRSKHYGIHDAASTPKRPKCDKEMREERLQTIEDEMSDIARMVRFKEKRLSQAEAGRNYKVCEQLTEEMMALKSRKRELDSEKRLFEQKKKRAKTREIRIQRVSKEKQESEPSDLDGGPRSKTTSTCSSPSESESSSDSRSVTPVCLRAMSSALQSPTSVSSSLQSEQIASDQRSGHLSLSDSQTSSNNLHSCEQGIQENPYPLSPTQHCSQIDPVVCESNSDSNTSSSVKPLQPCPLSPSQPGSRINPIECESTSLSSSEPSPSHDSLF